MYYFMCLYFILGIKCYPTNQKRVNAPENTVKAIKYDCKDNTCRKHVCNNAGYCWSPICSGNNGKPYHKEDGKCSGTGTTWCFERPSNVTY